MERQMVQLKKSPHHKLNLAVPYARISAAVWCCPYFSLRPLFKCIYDYFRILEILLLAFPSR